MLLRHILAGLLVWGLLPAAPRSAVTDPRAEPGRCEVDSRTFDWHDEVRQRAVPVRIYAPRSTDGRCPLLVFSHGLGGTRHSYEYLGRHWASHGYVVVHVQHLGSDDAAWRGQANPMASMRRAMADPRNLVNRPQDVSFAIDQMARLNRTESPYRGRLDLDRIGVAGHSFGAYTTMAIAGQVFTVATREISFADARVKAAIPMSTPMATRQGKEQAAFAKIRVPCFHMTGTEDHSPIGETDAAQRRVPYDHIDTTDQYLLTFAGGDHMVFSGRPRTPGGGESDAFFQSLVRAGSLAFWQAYLCGDADARRWLAEGGFKALLGQGGTLEMKLKA